MPYQSQIRRLVFEGFVTSLVQVILRFFRFGFDFWIHVQPEFSPATKGSLEIQSDDFILAASCQIMTASHSGSWIFPFSLYCLWQVSPKSFFLLFYGLGFRLSRQRTFHRPQMIRIDWLEGAFTTVLGWTSWGLGFRKTKDLLMCNCMHRIWWPSWGPRGESWLVKFCCLAKV